MSDQTLIYIIADYFKTKPVLKAWLFGSFARGEDNIMIIGEAANMLTKEFREEHAETPWRNIIDMCNVLVHGYYTASPLFIWETYSKDLGPLLDQVKKYISELQK